MCNNLPPLLSFETPQEYKAFYKKNLMENVVYTFDGIRVYFSETRFWHACEVADERGKKSIFSFHRASYLSWIRYTLENPDVKIYKGNHKDKTEKDRRVSLLLDKFVVVLQMKLKTDNTLKAEFITSFPINGSYASVKKSEPWNKDDCIRYLTLKK